MQMRGEQAIAASRQTVWEALNDPAVLAKCIPGCQSLDVDGENRFVAVTEVKIGPIGARFKGNVQLSDLDAPNGYTITGSGNGGIAGSAKGGAKVRLSDAAGGGTLVSYEVEAEVGGRMAQLGGPIIDATAKNLAGKFFTKFGEVVSAPAPVSDHGLDGSAAGTVASGKTSGTARAAAEIAPIRSPGSELAQTATTAPLWGWVIALILMLFTGFLLGQLSNSIVALSVAVLVIVTTSVGYEAGRRGARK